MIAAGAQKALRFVDRHEDALLAFLHTLVGTPSITRGMGERAVAAAVIAETRRLGLADPTVVCACEEHPNLLYRLAGAGAGPTLILNGHLDTQPVGERPAWTHDPFGAQVEDGCLFGLGASDMKAGVAAQVYALAALAHARAIRRGAVTLALVADEENGGAHGASWLLRNGHIQGDACVIGEPAGIYADWEAIYTGQRGQSGVWVRVGGERMHSGVARELGAANAAVEMARVIAALDHDLAIMPASAGTRAPATVGVLVCCGEAWGICPGTAEFGIDVRPEPGTTRADVARGLDAALARLRATRPGIDVGWHFAEAPQDWIAPTAVAAESAVVCAARVAAGLVLGYEPPPGVYPATTDACAFDACGIPTLPALGPGRITSAHRADEFVTLSSVTQAARIYVLLAMAFLEGL